MSKTAAGASHPHRIEAEHRIRRRGCGGAAVKAIRFRQIGRLDVRKPKLHTISWTKISTLRKQKFDALLSKHGEIFDEKFIEMVQKRRERLLNLTLKLTAIQVPILAFLTFALIPVDASVSVLGISPATNRNLREILIVFSAITGLLAVGLSVNRQTLSDIVQAYVDKRSKSDNEANEYLSIGHGLSFASLPNSDYGLLSFGRGYLMLLLLLIFLVISLFIITVGAALALHVLILRDIYYYPSYSHAVSLLVISLVIACDLLGLIWTLLATGFWPMQNLERLHALSRIEEKTPQRAKEIYKEMAMRYYKKPWLLRLITRPRLPKF